jgi:hypothetical protein
MPAAMAVSVVFMVFSSGLLHAAGGPLNLYESAASLQQGGGARKRAGSEIAPICDDAKIIRG